MIFLPSFAHITLLNVTKSACENFYKNLTNENIVHIFLSHLLTAFSLSVPLPMLNMLPSCAAVFSSQRAPRHEKTPLSFSQAHFLTKQAFKRPSGWGHAATFERLRSVPRSFKDFKNAGQVINLNEVKQRTQRRTIFVINWFDAQRYTLYIYKEKYICIGAIIVMEKIFF